jgi:hypothetical protein
MARPSQADGPRRDLSRPDEESCYQHAEDEPADVGEERDAPRLALALNNPKLPSISWYRTATAIVTSLNQLLDALALVRYSG